MTFARNHVEYNVERIPLKNGVLSIFLIIRQMHYLTNIVTPFFG